jgi:hypothetical protein
MQTLFEDARQQSMEVKREELNKRSLPVKLMDNFARLFSPYL